MTKPLTRLLTGIGLLLLACLTLPGLARADRSAAAPVEQQTNLLNNPGFEGSFEAWSGINEIQVAPGWTPWWVERPESNPALFRPEYKRADAAVFPYRVLSGGSSQQWFTFHASHLAGMYQQVFGVTPGVTYRFSIWAQVWSSLEDNPRTSVGPANPRLRIGLDPTGNWQAGAGTVVWSAEAPMAGVIDTWYEMSIEATAENNTITVFMRTNPDFANKHNDTYWDNASLVAVQAAQPTLPPPTETQVQTSATAQATSATAPAATVTTSATATATATVATDAATNQPEPTSDDTATPTESPSPTPTSELTATTTPERIVLPTVTPTTTPSATPSVAAAPIAETTSLPVGADRSDAPGAFSPLAWVLLILGIGLGLLAMISLLRRRRRGPNGGG